MQFEMRQLANGRQIVREKDFNPRSVVRVLPKNDLIRKYIKHPKTHVGWLAEGSCEWPNDAFTKRRIIDGDVRVEQAPAAATEASEPRSAAKRSDKS